MLPQRVHYDSAQPATPAEDELELRQEWVYHGDPHQPAVREPIASPARMLHQELQLRMGDLAAPGMPASSGGAIEAKLPMPARIATIVTISGLLWGGIYLALARLITG
ncbi:MAG: hypothetical protein J0I47_11625 [Sphingomonas sp.]|uniref:hypothetical protein n=1 Tax=Sphingomonas sp. TaxID=28214 RepID=UPI001AC0FCF0|nr:hypothetical protein [Sphingomonas sp.]MBN8808863.1 hypothetical protein [Sphingomonas sp.]